MVSRGREGREWGRRMVSRGRGMVSRGREGREGRRRMVSRGREGREGQEEDGE